MGVRWPVELGREDIKCWWFRLFPNEEWFKTDIVEEPPREVTIDCCCWLSSWSLGGEMGSDFIFTGAGDEDEGGGVLFDTAKWGIPLCMKRTETRIHS